MQSFHDDECSLHLSHKSGILSRIRNFYSKRKCPIIAEMSHFPREVRNGENILPVVLSLFESGITSPRDRDLSMRICRSSCGLEFGSCRPFSRGFADFAGTGRLLGTFSLFGCDGIIVILLCLRGCASATGAAGSAGFGTLCSNQKESSHFITALATRGVN